MPDSAELIGAARLLLASDAPDNGCLRRAVSTAYYAVFHHVLRSATDRLVGLGSQDAGPYEVLYRAFTHTRLADVCRLVRRPLTADLKRQIGRETVSEVVKKFGWAFLELQSARHSADYDPVGRQTLSGSQMLVFIAEIAIAHWDEIEADERLPIISLMLVNPRR